MLHLPEIPFSDIEKNLFEFAFICWSGISLFQFLRQKVQKPKGKRVSGSRKKRQTNANKKISKADIT